MIFFLSFQTRLRLANGTQEREIARLREDVRRKEASITRLKQKLSEAKTEREHFGAQLIEACDTKSLLETGVINGEPPRLLVIKAINMLQALNEGEAEIESEGEDAELLRQNAKIFLVNKSTQTPINFV